MFKVLETIFDFFTFKVSNQVEPIPIGLYDFVEELSDRIDSAKTRGELCDIATSIHKNRMKYLNYMLPHLGDCPRCTLYSDWVSELQDQIKIFLSIIQETEMKLENAMTHVGNRKLKQPEKNTKMVVFNHKQVNTDERNSNVLQILSASPSSFYPTDTFLLMTLIPAAQCFIKFVGNFLSKNESTLQDDNRVTNSSEEEILELVRNPLALPSPRSLQPWEHLIPVSMLRSTSLQNFSVSHFNFYSPCPVLPEPLEENQGSEKSLIDNHQQTISVMEDSLKLYENDVTYLENNLQALETRSRESDKLIHELERNVSKLNKLLERRDSELADANKKVHNYHKYYCWSLVQIANLMKEENSLRDENINLLLLMEECCSDNEYCEEKLKEYQEKLIQIEKEMSELTVDVQKRNQVFEEEKKKSYDEISTLNTENESLKVQCEVQQSEVDKCQQMMELYKKRIDQVKQLVDTKTLEISNLQNNVKSLEHELCHVQKEKATALDDFQMMRTKNEELSALTKTLTENSVHLETSLGEYKTKTVTLCETLGSLEQELKHSRDEVKHLKLNLNQMEDELNATKVSYESKLKQKIGELEACKAKAILAENEQKDQIDLMREEIAQNQGTVEACRTELEMVRTELKCKNELGKVIEEQHHRLDLSYEALYKEFTQTTSQLKERQCEIDKLNEAITTLRQQNEVLKQRETSFQTREQTLEQALLDKVKSFESEVMDKSHKIKHLEDLANKFSSQIEQYRREIEDKNEEINRLKQRLASTVNTGALSNNAEDVEARMGGKGVESPSMINAQEILSLLEINSAHCKRYHALEKAYKELSLECSALQQSLSLSPRTSSLERLSTKCNDHVTQIKKLTEENKYLQSTLADYKRINSLLLDQIKVSVNHPDDSLPPQTLTTLYDVPEKEDTHSTLSVEDRNTVDLWWENEVSLPPTLSYDTRPCTETKSL